MNAEMRDLTWTYFSYRGRIGRSRFWWSNVGLNIAQAAAQFAFGLPQALFVGGIEAEPPAPSRALGALLISLAALYPTSALMVKRAHDRGRPAWISLSILFGATLGSIIAGLIMPKAAILFSLGLIVYVVVDLLLLPSDPHENRFGPAPTSSFTATRQPTVLQG